MLIRNGHPESDVRDLMLIVGRALDGQVDGDVWRFLGQQGARWKLRWS